MLNDIFTRTIAFLAASIAIFATADWRWLLLALVLSGTIAVGSGCNRRLLTIAVLAPIVPIVGSHFVIEPILGRFSIDLEVTTKAAGAWMRICAMTLLSLSWLSNLKLCNGAQLAQVSGGGQLVLIVFLTAISFFRTAADRWISIRESHSLMHAGALDQRRRLSIKKLPEVGFQFVMASLIAAPDTALALSGRGIGERRTIAVRISRPNFASVAIVTMEIIFLCALEVTGSLR